MKNYSRLLWLAFFAMLIAVGLLVVPGATKRVVANPGTVIDNYSVTQSLEQSGVGSNFAYVDNGPASIIGGQRELTVTVTEAGSGPKATVDINAGGYGQLAHSQGSGTKGKSIYTYDGTSDGGAAGVDATTGLGGVDVTNGGDGNAFVVLVIETDSSQATMKFTVYSSPSACSSVSKNVPTNISGLPRVIVFKFSEFSSADGGAGCSSAVTLTSVRAIVIEIDGTTYSSADVTLDLIETAKLDYGDLPSNYSSITTGNDAAGHVISTLKMGSLIDTETDGQQNSGDALKDDQTTSDDEDGVTMLGTQWNAGSTNQVRVNVNGDGCVAAWIDWNNDGDFQDAGENILSNASVTSGNNDLTFNVPSGIPATATYYSRFRLYPRDSGGGCTTTKSYKYQAYNGEVEDHEIGYKPTAVTLTSLEANAEPFNPLIPVAGIVGVAGMLGAFVLKRRRN